MPNSWAILGLPSNQLSSSLLRHKNVTMTQRYLRLLDEDFEERARRVDMLSGISLPGGRRPEKPAEATGPSPTPDQSA